MRVVLVVDNPAYPIGETTTKLRATPGLDVRVASNPDEFCLNLTQTSVDAVVIPSDIMLPWGGKFFRQLRHLESYATIFVVKQLAASTTSLRAFSRNKEAASRNEAMIFDLLTALDPEAGRCQTMIANRARFSFCLESNPAIIQSVVDFVENLAAFRARLSEYEILSLKIAVVEALTNAILHGNLEVNSSLKESDDDAFEKLVAIRRQQEPYSSRKVMISLEAETDRFRCKITDEGAGFDQKSVADPRDLDNLSKPSGRGLLLMCSAMDDVIWNETGNEVSMLKCFSNRQSGKDRRRKPQQSKLESQPVHA